MYINHHSATKMAVPVADAGGITPATGVQRLLLCHRGEKGPLTRGLGAEC